MGVYGVGRLTDASTVSNRARDLRQAVQGRAGTTTRDREAATDVSASLAQAPRPFAPRGVSRIRTYREPKLREVRAEGEAMVVGLREVDGPGLMGLAYLVPDPPAPESMQVTIFVEMRPPEEN